MIYIFHGDDQFASRSCLNNSLSQHKDKEVLRLDNKKVDLDVINNFINSQSLFQTQKILVISNFFSINKANLNKIIDLINQNKSVTLLIWQDKKLNVSQLKIFPEAKVRDFPLNKILFNCLYKIQPKNLIYFMPMFKKVIKKEPFELFLYLIKNNLKKQLTTYSKFEKKQLKEAYLKLIEIDFQNKSGQLAVPKELALEQVLYNLLK